MTCCIVTQCSGVKLSTPAKAKDLYQGPAFKKARVLAERCSVPWFIFSSKYGLLDPERMIEPYELALWHNNNMKAAARAGKPLPPLADPKVVLMLKIEATKILSGYDRRIIYLMSRKYCENLPQGEQPLYSLGFLSQIGWLAKATPDTLGL